MRDVVAMQRAEEQSPQNQHVERALEEVDTGLFSSFVFFRHNASGRFSTGVSGGTGRMSMGEANFSTRACARGLLHWKFSSYANWLGIEGRQTLRYGERQRPEYRSKDLSIGAQVADAPCTVSMGAPHRIYGRPRLTCRFATTMPSIRSGARSSGRLSSPFAPERGRPARRRRSTRRRRLRT